MKLPKFRPVDADAGAPGLSAGKSVAPRGADRTEGRDISESPPPWWRNEWLLGIFLVAMTVMAYQPVWRAGFIWDDDSFLTHNPVMQSADGLRQMWLTTSAMDYVPMTSSMLWLEWRLWSEHPAGYHLMNVFLHAFSAVLLWRALARLKISGAWLAAGIFALHPVNVESVAWVTERKNTLCMFFYAGALLAWLKFEDSGRRRWYGLALGAFALALFSKTAAAPLPVVLLILAWWRRGRVDRKDVFRISPFFMIAAGSALVALWFQNRAIASVAVRTDGFWPRLAGAGWAVWFYLYKALLPIHLIFVYPRWQIDGRNLLSYLPLALLAAAFILCWRWRRNRGRAVFFALAYFVVMLLPVLGFLNIFFMRYSLVADHWQYFAIIGPIALAAGIIRKPIVAATLLLALGALTWRQCGVYANIETLWRSTIALNPDCWLAQNGLGNILDQEGNAGEAFVHFQKAVEIKPDYAEAQNNLGNALQRRGNWDEAILHFQKALALSPSDAAFQNNLAWLLATCPEAAWRDGRKAVKLAAKANASTGGRNPIILRTCAAAFAEAGRFDEAIKSDQEARELARAAGREDIVEQIGIELTRYAAKEPLHD